MIVNTEVLVDSAIFNGTRVSVESFQNELFNLIVTQQENLYFKNGDSLIGRVTKPEREFVEGAAGFKEIAYCATAVLLVNISVNVVADVAIDQSNNIVDEQRIEEVRKKVVDVLNMGKPTLVQGVLIVFKLVDGKIKASKKKGE